ncbi:MAG: proline racemase family protein [Pseudomonadota bacterium]
MRWKRSLQTVDVHCAGEIGRVITGGMLGIPGDTMAAKLEHLNTVDDEIRRFLCSEPRGGPAGSFVLITPPTVEEADIGMIVLQPDQAHAMSGSNAMCAVTAILETGMKEMNEPKTVITLDTAAGLVQATADCVDGKVSRVSLEMPPSFVVEKGAVIEAPDWGPVHYDLCYGGVFYALVDVEQLDLCIVPENARELATLGVTLLEHIKKDTRIAHPETPEINGVAYVMFRSDETDGAVRTCTTLPPGRIDRSPCGTGSNANMAVRYFDGRAKPGDEVISRSTIGGEFTTRFLEEVQVGPYKATRNRVSGQSWIYGISQIGLDPTDPFPNGFVLSDTWGRPA